MIPELDEKWYVHDPDLLAVRNLLLTGIQTLREIEARMAAINEARRRLLESRGNGHAQ